MKKFIFMMVAVFAMAVSATAQQTNYAGSTKFTDNWSVGVNGGVQTNLHDWNAPQGAVFGITLNKQLTPLFGLTFEANGGVNNRMNWYAGQEHFHNGTIIDQFSVLADGRFNLVNAFWGYKGTPRLFEVEALAGVGYGHGYAIESCDYQKTNALLAKAGLNLNFNLGEKKAWTVYVQPAVEFNTSATGQFNCKYAVGQLTAGFVYHFKNSNKKHYEELPVPVIVEKPVEKIVEKIVEKEVIVKDTVTVAAKNTDSAWKVSFAQGSSKITSDVTEIANAIKNSNAKCVISGFTSPEGSEKVNKALGLARANALKDALVEAGVEADQIEIDNAYESLRTATVKLK